jgi:hypothetical protein
MPTQPADTSSLTADLKDAIRTEDDHLTDSLLVPNTRSFLEASVTGKISVLETLSSELHKAHVLIATRAGITPVGYRLQGMIELLSGMAVDTLRKHQLAVPVEGIGRSKN